MADNNLPDKILVVDDDPTVAGAIAQPLSKYGIKVMSAADLDTAFYLFNQNRFEVVCVELDFEPQPGLVMLQKWRNHEMHEKSKVGVVLLVGNRNERNSGEQKLIQEVRDVHTLVKPFTAVQLLPLLAKARVSRQRALKYEEIKGTVFKLGARPEKVDKAVAMVQKQLPDLGVRGLEMMMELYERAERFQDALGIADTLLKKDGNNVGYINARGRILLRMGRHDEALKLMEKADTAAPNNIARINKMAELYMSVSKPDAAVKKMKQLIGFHPEVPEMKFDMFSQLQEHGYDDHALSLCKETTSPIEVVRYYNNKGVALKNMGSVDEALNEYERSLKFYPTFKENYRILYNIALAHISRKTPSSYRMAVKYLDQCLELKKDFDKAFIKKQQLQKALKKVASKKKKGA